MADEQAIVYRVTAPIPAIGARVGDYLVHRPGLDHPRRVELVRKIPEGLAQSIPWGDLTEVLRKGPPRLELVRC